MSDTTPRGGALHELRRLIPYVRKHTKLVVLGLIFVTISNICSTTIPYVVGSTIDTLGSSSFTSTDVAWLIAKILALTIGSGFFMFATRRTIIVMSRYIEEALRNDVVAAVKDQSQRFFNERSTGSILAHFSNDIGSVRDFIGPAIMYTANTITMFAFALSWMTSLDVLLTAAILIPVPLVATLTYRLGKRIHGTYKVVQQEYEHITTHAQETASGIRVIRAYVRGAFEALRFDALSKSYYERNMQLARVQSLMMPGMTVLFNISYIIVLTVGGYQVMHKALTVGELTQFFIYLNQLLWPIAAIGWVTSMIQRGAASIGRLGALYDAPSDVTSPLVPRDIAIAGTVTLDHVSLSYDGTARILDDISVTVPAGTSLGIVGAVGSGKSTLVGLVPRLYDVSSGSVRIDGVDVRELDLHALRSAIAVVPQEAFLFSETIRDNIRFGNPDASDEDVVSAATRAQLHGDIMQLAEGYDTVVGERGVTLSGGQKQRTSLARAIAADPKILILDDALSAIDADTEDRVLRELQHIMANRTTIIISHRLSTVQQCTKIIVLENGRIIESGSHAELVQHNGIYAAMFERQQLEQQLS
jgi:ATP-binding cassette subfamily B protein